MEDAALQAVVRAFIRVGVTGVCFPASAMLHEMLPGSRLVQGYNVIEGGRYCAWHVWVTLDGGDDLNPGAAISYAQFPREARKRMEAAGAEWLSEKEVGKRMDLMHVDADELESLAVDQAMLAMYRRSPERFWRAVPESIRTIRRRLLKLAKVWNGRSGHPRRHHHPTAAATASATATTDGAMRHTSTAGATVSCSRNAYLLRGAA